MNADPETVCQVQDAERYGPLVRDALMDALHDGAGHRAQVARAFADWLADERGAVLTILYPNEWTHAEQIYKFREQFVAERLQNDGWQAVNRMFGLGIKQGEKS